MSDDLLLHYLAGIMDAKAELRQRGSQPSLRISDTNRSLIELLQASFGGRIGRQENTHVYKNARPEYRLEIGQQDTRAALAAVTPHMRIRGAQFRDIMRFDVGTGATAESPEKYGTGRGTSAPTNPSEGNP
jgi:hypothetical protein